jgi:hypothetical protein
MAQLMGLLGRGGQGGLGGLGGMGAGGGMAGAGGMPGLGGMGMGGIPTVYPSPLGVGGTGAGTGAGVGPLLPTTEMPSLGELTAIPEALPPGMPPGISPNTVPLAPLAGSAATPGLAGTEPSPFRQFLQAHYGIGGAPGQTGLSPIAMLLQAWLGSRR